MISGFDVVFRFSARVAGLALLGAASTLAVRGADDPSRVADENLPRLIALGEVWGEVRFCHPWFGDREIEWDRALLEAIPRVYAAESREAYAGIVQTMLARLGDPATRIAATHRAPPTPSSRAAMPEPYMWLSPRVMNVPAGEILATAGFSDATKAGAAISSALDNADAVIFDLRGPAVLRNPGDNWNAHLARLFWGRFREKLSNRALKLPATRSLLYSGWRADSNDGASDYQPLFVTEPSGVLPPGSRVSPLKIIFIVDAQSTLPRFAVAMQGEGLARIVGDGPVTDSLLVKTRRVKLPDDLEVVIRVNELVTDAGPLRVRVDREVGSSGHRASDLALQAALELIAETSTRPAPPPATAAPMPTPTPIWRPHQAYPEMRLPDLPHRLLAVFRFGSVMQHLNPYLRFAEDWRAVLPKYIRQMEAATDASAYALCVAEMAAGLHDAHAEISGSPELEAFFGQAELPISVLVIEEHVVVTAVKEPARQAGVQVGDVIVSVDGQSAAERMKRISRYIPASTPAHLHLRAANRILRGSKGGVALLELRGATGTIKHVKLARTTERSAANTEAAFRRLDGNFGYVNLTRLETLDVEAMFAALGDTRAMIFDLRGYPRGTGWAIAPRLNVRAARNGAAYERPQFSGANLGTRLKFFDELPRGAGEPLYHGKIVVLIDERALSQAEHTALFFREAAGAVFVGSPTAGVNGDRTDVVLPGGIYVGFSGSDVSHVNGETLQTVGITPDIEIKPTIAGIRAGRDEVLEGAIAFLSGSN
jgi:C-terminal processing protease CtpA/Prc